MQQGRSSFKYFLAAFWPKWFTKMSGPATVPFTIAAVLLPSTWGKALCAVLAILCGVTSSYAVWAAERKQVEELSARLTRKLKIMSRVSAQPWIDHRGNCVSYYIDVVNESDATTVDGVEVALTAIDPDMLHWLPVPLGIKHDISPIRQRSFSLNPLSKKQVDLVSSVQGSAVIDICHSIGGPVNVPAGRYVVTVTASGRDTVPDSQKFIVWVDNTGYLKCEVRPL